MRRRHVVTALLVVLGTAGAASAYWTTSGGGTADAATGAPVPVELRPGTPAAALRPGGTSDVVLTAVNPAGAASLLPSLRLSAGQGTAGFQVDDTHPGCTPASFSLTSPSFGGTGTGWTVPAASGGTPGTLEITLPAALAMDAAAPNGCQGASVTVYLEVGP